MANKWYFVEATPQQFQALAEQKVMVYEMEIRRPRELVGIGFPEAELEKVRTVVNIPERFSEEATDNDGVFLLAPWTRVTLESTRDMEHKDEVVGVLKEFAEALDIEIYVKNVHGNDVDPAKTEVGKLFIRFWTTPTIVREARTPKVFGIKLTAGQADGCQPSGEGTVLKDDQDVVFGEVHGGTLYVLFDLPHGNNADKLMRLVMEKFLAAVDPKKFEETLRKQEEARREAEEWLIRESRANYVRECAGRLKEYVVITNEEIKEVRGKLKELSQQVVEYTRKEMALEMKKLGLSEISPDMEKKFGEEFDKLCALPHVKKVIAQRGTVSVFTDTIFLKYEGETYELGDYRIDMHSNGGLNIVNTRVIELTRQEEFQHPHVFYEGGTHVCLGNIGHGVHKLIGSYEFSIAAQILIEFLHTMTKSSQYIHHLTNNWKPLPKETS